MKTTHQRTTSLLFLSCFTWVCGAAIAMASSPSSTDQARAVEVLGPFKQSLKKALVAGMAEGPVHAVEACQLKAPGIAETASQDGARVGRASHRLRNPANVAPDWVQPILDAWAADASNAGPKQVALDGGRTGYVEPIYVDALCVTCHGAQLAPDVAAKIDALYPDDRATGFDVGDFRGLFWVDLPPATE